MGQREQKTLQWKELDWMEDWDNKCNYKHNQKEQIYIDKNGSYGLNFLKSALMVMTCMISLWM